MKKNFIKKIVLIGGILIATVGLLTGCGKKDNETKTYDKENEVVQNVTNSESYAEKISTEEKVKIAYYLHSLEGDFSSSQDLSDENILWILTYNNVNVVDYNKTTEQSAINMFENYDSSYCEIRVFKESELQKAAKDLFGVNLTNGISNFNNAYLNRILKYDNGEYYYLHIDASGESLTIKNISNDGDTYTFFALNTLDSDKKDISEYYKYEVVITNGVIKSCREAMETEETTTNNNTNKNDSTNSENSWKSSYIDKLKATEQEAKAEQGDLYSDYEDKYSIYDINGDGIPELLVHKGTSEADWTLNVYTYKNNDLVKIGFVQFSHCALYKMYGENYLKLVHGHMGYEDVYKLYMNDSGDLVQAKVSERELAIDEDYEEGDEYLETYAYNDLNAINNYTQNH